MNEEIDTNKWSYLHRWWDKVKNEEIPPPVCPNDEYPLYPGINKEDDPMLRCLVCKTTVQLGSNFYEGGY